MYSVIDEGGDVIEDGLDFDEATTLCAVNEGSFFVDDEGVKCGDSEDCAAALVENEVTDGIHPDESDAGGADDSASGRTGKVIFVELEITDVFEEHDDNGDPADGGHGEIGPLVESTWTEEYFSGGEAFDRIAAVEFNGGVVDVLTVERADLEDEAT